MILLVALWFADATAQAEIATILQRAEAAATAQEQRGYKYTHRVERQDYSVDKKGAQTATGSKTYDVIMLEGAEYTKVILVNGKTPDAAAQKKIDADLERERQTRKRNRTTLRSVTRSTSLGGLSDLGRLYDNRVASDELVGGRQAWRVDSEPKSGLASQAKRDEEILRKRVTTWFDKADGAVVRRRTEVVREVNGFLPGSIFEEVYAKVGDDWTIAEQDYQVILKPAPLVHIRGRSHYRHTGYKRFVAESQIVEPAPESH